ncbi:flagellar biosynthetic protein FliO [Proteus sp. GOKU]|jgi:flagellar protein FliO/FliZ|uniref:Flagellar protein n=1 Tax=Proteus terrae subsp. cibarius TaxID=626774 RepID=A0ABX6JJK3_9GAMM|nr:MULTISPECIES: flagellar biosynthetic protein FliO [Proteus]EST58463.1 flagellar protein [Proteus hauseri ZMd44]MDY3693362.1 flagellar biosynthetic protein FliO [Proteus mirabilis]MBG6031929.1 flagellar biosynthetic protein FliO [Proteus hauseri]NBN72945.1 flagellar biosynthetic protein FliO [Proteus sp. G2618]PNL50320.1 flagellar biosynthetic protein FliO [Proteus mirabilis]
MEQLPSFSSQGAVNTTAPATTQTVQTPTQPLPVGQSLAQVSTALAGIIVLIIVAMWLFRRFGFTRGSFKGTTAQLSVKASCSLGAKERVVVVEIEQEWLVLGVTASQVNLLHKLPVPDKASQEATSSPTSPLFTQILQKTLKRDKGNS